MQDIKVIGQEKVGNIKFTGIEGGFGKDKKAMLVKFELPASSSVYGRVKGEKIL